MEKHYIILLTCTVLEMIYTAEMKMEKRYTPSVDNVSPGLSTMPGLKQALIKP